MVKSSANMMVKDNSRTVIDKDNTWSFVMLHEK
jgi:hypothetical protein